ncbi:MAG TPA: SMC-Scp complex subunit ScpB [Candidatus Kapabacteria bacterium]|nr:SMC-Scp complex subunit ScpB [Candidatus Kapabacteria bacterium]
MAKKKTTLSEDTKRIIEALIFASDESLSPKELRVLIEGESKPKKKKVPVVIGEQGEELPAPDMNGEVAVDALEPAKMEEEAPVEESEDEDTGSELNAKTIRAIVDELNAEYEQESRAFRIVEIAGGFQFATRKEYGVYVGRLTKDRSRRRLSQAALEVLAIVAYRQPIPKPEIESIRGVNCDEVIQSLLEKDLITIAGRAESVGRPLLFGTTDAFLRYFGLASLKDLPRPREIDELLEARGILPEQMILEIPAGENVQEIEDHLAPQHLQGLAEVATAEEIEIEEEDIEDEEEEELEELEEQEEEDDDAPSVGSPAKDIPQE